MPIECTGKIAAVCVYPDQAQIVRRALVTVSTRETEILFPNLPLSLQPETVRVAGRGTARVRLLGVEVTQVRYALPPEEALRELGKQIEELEDRNRALGDRVEMLNRSLELLSALGKATADRLPWGIARGTVDPAQVESLLAIFPRAEEETRRQIRELEVQRRELGRELERLRRERDARLKPRTPDRYQVSVPIEVEEPGELEVELSYVCREATWKPLYDLRFDESGPSLLLSLLAEVSQRTGEDWSEIQLTLSTARPALGRTLPEIQPWYIHLRRPQPVEAAAPRMLAMAEELPEAAPQLLGETLLEEARMAEAEIRQEGTAVVFLAPGAPSVPADGSTRKVLLGTHSLPVTLDWITAPKQEPYVFRRARAKNTTPSVLLPGNGSVFYGDTFVGTATVAETPVGGEIELSLGVDDRVKVERELVERAVDKSGFVEKLRRVQYSYRIRVQNLRSEPIALTVLDQIPVSRHESLKVKLLRSDPQAQAGPMGELRWEMKAGPGEKREITFAFQVEMPLESEAIGLP